MELVDVNALRKTLVFASPKEAIAFAASLLTTVRHGGFNEDFVVTHNKTEIELRVRVESTK